MSRIVFLTNMERQFAAVQRAQQAGLFGDFEAELRRIDAETVWDPTWETLFRKADFVLLTYMGSGLDTAFLRTCSRFGRAHDCRFVMLIDSEVTEEMQAGLTAADIAELRRYMTYGGTQNYGQMLRWCAVRFGGATIEYEEPQEMPLEGIWHPADGKIYPTLAAYRAAVDLPERPCVGVLFYREEWLAGDLAYQRAFAEELERVGLQGILCFAQHARGGDPETTAAASLRRLFGKPDGSLDLSVLIHLGKFSLIGLREMTADDWAAFDVPVLQGYCMSSSEEEWRADVQGLNAMDVNLAVTLPEMDGVLHAGVAAGSRLDEDGNRYYEPIRERIAALARRAKKWSVLRTKPNAEKKIALVFHNYPPDNANIGSAAGLDSIESVRRLLLRMQQEGYVVERIPEDTAEFIDLLTTHATNDREFVNEEFYRQADGKLKPEAYRRWFSQRGEKVREAMQRDWGEAPGTLFYYEDSVIIPGLWNGNIFITMQPPRGFSDSPEKLYHSPDMTPTHHYEGFYYWLREEVGVDAMLHIGTHGTLEWLPGKGAGLSADCYSEMATDEVPNIYPYWTNIVGEGIQAKRRSSACLVGHLSPPQDRSGLYEEMEELQNLLDEYFHFRTEKPEAMPALLERIIEKAKEAHMLEEIPHAESMSIEDLTSALHAYLSDLSQVPMWVGLHIFGQAPEGRKKLLQVTNLTRVRNGEIPSLPETVAEAKGFTWDELQGDPKRVADDGLLYSEHISRIWEECEALLADLAAADYCYTDAWRKRPASRQYTEAGREKIAHILRWIATDLAVRLDRTREEEEHVLAALAGHYIPTGPGGAASSGRVDILPTGRNFYGVDTRKLPTEAAWEIGSYLAEEVITQYIAEEGRYPESVGIVVWAGANTRSHGQCIAQYLKLLGVRPVWQKGSGRVIGVEAIPLAELGRPRVDVTARISGLFRDMMPNPAQWLDEAVHLVASLDEPNELNYLKKHIEEDVDWLMEEEGLTREEAFEQARWRIFGDPPGAYGAGVSDLLENKNWETIDDIGDVYVRWGGHAYRQGKEAQYAPGLFRRRLAQMEITVQNTDNRELSMLSSDDYNAYHGGLIAAVRSNRGEAPRSFTGDSSDRQRVKVRTLQAEMHRLFRAETVNPKFIAAMREHGYKGASDLADYLAHAYQWDVTSSVLENWMYDSLADKYALADDMREWFGEVNPWALRRMAEVLLEAARRGLWDASEERKQALEDIYLTVEGDLEEKTDRKGDEV